MKKIALLTTFAFALVSFNLMAQDTIPNPNFENWLSNTNPESWNTVNDLLPFGNACCFQSTDSYEGDYALFMKTIDMEGLLVPAVTSLGTVGMGYTEGGIPFKSRPESLTGYYKHPSAGDVVMLSAEFFRNGETIGHAYWATSDSVAEYTLLNIPVTFISAEEPDTLNITILTDQNILGSTLTLDGFMFNYPPVLQEEINSVNVNVYPNPTKDFLQIEYGKIVDKLQISNLNGHVILEKHGIQKLERINIQALPKGTYIMRLQCGTSVYHKKIIKK